jgi:mersacidin/lichenicidin family type 2 lantibiotic
MEFDIVRAWKDVCYRQSLSSEQLALLPESPVGDFELSEAELETINGGGQGGSQAVCRFTGDNMAQCSTRGHSKGSCAPLTDGPHSIALGSGTLLTDVSELTGDLSFLCA